MPEVQVSGHAVLMDQEDLDVFEVEKWRVMNVNGKLYVCRRPSRKNGASFELFHRMIMACPEGMMIDHKNGETLDCRKENLRICTHSQNMRNRRLSKSNKCGFKGVHEDSKCPGIFIAKIRCEGKLYRLGRFNDPKTAHAAYCEAATRLHGEFARMA